MAGAKSLKMKTKAKPVKTNLKNIKIQTKERVLEIDKALISLQTKIRTTEVKETDENKKSKLPISNTMPDAKTEQGNKEATNKLEKMQL